MQQDSARSGTLLHDSDEDARRRREISVGMSDAPETGQAADASGATRAELESQPSFQPTVYGGVAYYYDGTQPAYYLGKCIRQLEEQKAQAWQGIAGTAAPGLGPVAGFMAIGTMIATFGLFGTSLAQLILGQSEPKQPGSLEIGVTNVSSSAVVLYSCSNIGKATVAKSLDPLGPGDSDTFLLRTPEAMQEGDGGLLSLAVTQGGVLIPVTLGYTLNRGGIWTFSATVDGKQSNLQQNLFLFAALFLADGPHPSFSFYTSGIASGSGRIGLTFYDLPSLP
jgi:hypothetical protein